MGGNTFTHRVPKNGKSARDVFDDLVRNAQYEHGHGGYTGTIAEKCVVGFVMFEAGGRPADEYISALEADCNDTFPNNPFNDKWGPAGCIEDGDDWVFFGSASA